MEGSPSEGEASRRGREAVGPLVAIGHRLGYEVQTEVVVPGGRIDVVWFVSAPAALSGDGRLPLVGFEVESSWRTRKHIKGDYLNLLDLGAAVGVIVPLGEGDDVEATRRFARALIDRPGSPVLAWDAEDLAEIDGQALHGGGPAATSAPEQPSSAPPRGPNSQHRGKYAGLWRWLQGQPDDQLRLSFEQVEEIIGAPLPTSCRAYAAHWHSYDGSAVARAILDAGWRGTDVSLSRQELVLRRGD